MSEPLEACVKRQYKRSTKIERDSHVRTWKQSGLSMREYCENHALAVGTFSEWAKKQILSDTGFLPIKIKQEDSRVGEASVIEIYAGTSIKIRCINVPDLQSIVLLVRGLM